MFIIIYYILHDLNWSCLTIW